MPRSSASSSKNSNNQLHSLLTHSSSSFFFSLFFFFFGKTHTYILKILNPIDNPKKYPKIWKNPIQCRDRVLLPQKTPTIPAKMLNQERDVYLRVHICAIHII